MRKQSLKRALYLILIPLFTFNFFMNCSGFDENSSSVEFVNSDVNSQNYTVQSSEQLIRSLSSVTGVDYTTTIVNEFNSRKPLMSSDYTLDSITAPMLISISNLSSQFCGELVRKEASLTAQNRTYFSQVDLGKGYANLRPEQFSQTLETLGMKFWGRSLTSEEQTILNETKDEYIAATPEASRTSSTQTRNLMISICTSMLSSFDFITL